jgi:excisionase family DNA binding protein
MEERISEVSERLNISRFTLAQAAKRGKLGGAARQKGRNWLIQVAHEDFQKWLVAHALRSATAQVEQS